MGSQLWLSTVCKRALFCAGCAFLTLMVPLFALVLFVCFVFLCARSGDDGPAATAGDVYILGCAVPEKFGFGGRWSHLG